MGSICCIAGQTWENCNLLSGLKWEVELCVPMWHACMLGRQTCSGSWSGKVARLTCCWAVAAATPHWPGWEENRLILLETSLPASLRGHDMPCCLQEVGSRTLQGESLKHVCLRRRPLLLSSLSEEGKALPLKQTVSPSLGRASNSQTKRTA